MALLPAMARELRHQHDGLLGWLTASQGVGALAVVAGGSAIATAVGKRPRRMGLAGPLLAIVTGTRESLAVLAVAATIWTLRLPWGLLVHRPGLPIGTPRDLRGAVLEGAAR